MVRWIKLFGNQYLGFWVLGLVLFALQEIPYMLMPLFGVKRGTFFRSKCAFNTCIDKLEFITPTDKATRNVILVY